MDDKNWIFRFYKFVMFPAFFGTNSFMKRVGKNFQRTYLNCICTLLHYIIIPGTLLLLAMLDKRLWVLTFIIAVVTIITQCLFKTCLFHEIESYVKRWNENGNENGDEKWDIEVLRWSEKIERRPYFYLRFCVLGTIYLFMVLCVGLRHFHWFV